jgi:hypothetical protein
MASTLALEEYDRLQAMQIQPTTLLLTSALKSREAEFRILAGAVSNFLEERGVRR